MQLTCCYQNKENTNYTHLICTHDSRIEIFKYCNLKEYENVSFILYPHLIQACIIPVMNVVFLNFDFHIYIKHIKL